MPPNVRSDLLPLIPRVFVPSLRCSRRLSRNLSLSAEYLLSSSSVAETRPNAPAGAVAMLSQIVLCRPVPMMPDFNAEEKASIEKDAGEMRHIIAEMAECMPKEDPDKGTW